MSENFDRTKIFTTNHIKISYALSAQSAKFESIAQGNLGEMLKVLSDLGFDGVELGIRDPEAFDIAAMEKLLGKYDFDLSAIGTGQVFVDEGISLSDDDKTVRTSAVEKLKKQVGVAKVFNSHVILGLIIGNIGSQPEEKARKFSYIKNSLVEVSEYASKNNVQIVIEPLNRYERDVFNTAAEVNDLINDGSCPALGLLLDTFHMNIEEADILETIRASASSLKHVHLADSNRLSPGRGHLNFREIIGTLKDINYKGYLSFEHAPSPSMEEAAANSFDHIKKIFLNNAIGGS